LVGGNIFRAVYRLGVTLASRLGMYGNEYTGYTAVVLRLLGLLRRYGGALVTGLGCSSGYIAWIMSRISRISVVLMVLILGLNVGGLRGLRVKPTAWWRYGIIDGRVVKRDIGEVVVKCLGERATRIAVLLKRVMLKCWGLTLLKALGLKLTLYEAVEKG